MVDSDKIIHFILNHGGLFVLEDGLIFYLGGSEVEFQIKFSELTLEKLIATLGALIGFNSGMALYYNVPGMDLFEGKRVLSNDMHMDELKDLMEDNDCFVLFVEHEIGLPLRVCIDDPTMSETASFVTASIASAVSGAVGNEINDGNSIGGEDVDSDEALQWKANIRAFKRNAGLPEDTSDEEEYQDILGPHVFEGRDYISDSDASFCTDSEEEGCLRRCKHRYPVYNTDTIPTFELGLTFVGAAQFREACRLYGIYNQYHIDFPRNIKKQVKAKCAASGCPWFVYASFEKDIRKFQVKTANLEHNCQKLSKNPMATSTWLAQNYAVRKLRICPDLKTREVKDMIKDDLKLSITTDQAKKVKKKAKQLLKGDPTEEYARLPAYAEEMMRVMPGSTVRCDSKVGEDGVRRFWRFYCCLDPVKKGFKHCRPFIGLDGTFLKTEYRGQLLTACARDGDNHMFPLAWAIVEKENSATWTWFLSLLRQDVETEEGDGYTLISDQQKGLMNAISDLLPRAEQRYCSRHLFANFRKRHRGEDLERCFWNSVHATVVDEMSHWLTQMRQHSIAAYQEMWMKDPRLWSRAYMTNLSQCDVTDNNLSEGFNAWIYFLRDQYSYSLLDGIRIKVMRRMQEMRDQVNEWEMNLGPKVRKLIKTYIRKSHSCEVVWNGSWGYEVTEGTKRYVVNIANKSCTCRVWHISGIPCQHGCCVIRHRGEYVYAYVSHWYTKETNLKIYSDMLMPIEGPAAWENVREFPHLSPPIPEVMTGRPKKKRTRDPTEIRSARGKRLTRTNRIITCRLCGRQGHNKTTCPFRTNVGEQNVANVPAEPGPVNEGNLASVEGRIPGAVNAMSNTQEEINIPMESTQPVVLSQQPRQVYQTRFQPPRSSKRAIDFN